MGRPRIFTSSDELDEAIEKYSEYCEENKEPFTIIGLAVFIGINKDTLIEYSKNDDFSVSYKKALDLAESHLVKYSLTGKYNPTVSIFMLKNNHGYKDKQEMEHSGKMEVDMNKELTQEEIEAELKKRGLPLDLIGHRTT